MQHVFMWSAPHIITPPPKKIVSVLSEASGWIGLFLGNELKDEALGTERIMTMMMARDFI